MSSFPFPPAFETRMRQTLQHEWTAFAQEHLQAFPVSIRLNPEKHAAKIQGPKIPWTTNGYYLQERPVFTLDPSFHAGAYYVQEASSMFLEQAFRQRTDHDASLNVLDLCAAPGGKSTHIASLLTKKSLLVSNEVIRSRANILAENVQKWGSSNVVVTNNDPEDFQKLTGFFDVIVVDAPCSGEGLFRKDPEAMKEWSPDNVALCSARQKRILSDVWPALKQNGILIYCTCTFNEAENEDNLRWLQQQHDVEFIELKTEDHWGIEKIAQGNAVGYRCYPHKVKGEGFFLTVIRKQEAQQEIKTKASKNIFLPPSKKITEQIHTWVLSPEEKAFIQRDDLIQFFPSDRKQDIEFLARNLRLMSAGTFLATTKHDKLIPEHTLSLSCEINAENFHHLTLTREEALRYLRKENLALTPDYRGFALVTHEGFALGWANVLPNRINNMYPPEWRIRMQ